MPPVFPLPVDPYVCFDISELDLCRVVMPGGFEMGGINLLDQMQPAIAPLVPLFNIIEAIVYIKKVFEAVITALGPPPDPTALIDAIPGLSEAIAKLAKLAPQISIPLMAINLLDCIIGELQRLKSFVSGLLLQLARIAAVLEKAAELNDPQLNLIALCSQARLEGNLDDRMKALFVVGRLLGALRSLLDLIGIGGELIPDIEEITNAGIDEVMGPIDSSLERLITLRDRIPAPEET
jgi:hypothetical protein